MNGGNRARRSLTIHGIERYGIGNAEHGLSVRSGEKSAHSLGRNRTCGAGVDALHVDSRLVARFRAGKYNVLAIRKKAGAAPVNRIMRDLPCLPDANGNQKKLTWNM